MNLQHLCSIDRAGSIDSACYDFQNNAGIVSVTHPVSSGLTPKTGKAAESAPGAMLVGSN